MKQKLIRLSQRYETALRTHLRPGAHHSLQPALALGRQAVTLGMEMLELARMHERALTSLDLPKGKNGQNKRAEIFFTEAITPIVETPRAARQSKTDLHQLKMTLGQRKVMLVTAEKNGQHHKKCLEESLERQRRLRQLTHRVLAAQEADRKNISRELQDGIVQTLLGINVRLLTLKQASRSSAQGFKNEIMSTQRLVVKSARSVRQFAQELDLIQPVHQPPKKHNAVRVTTLVFPVIAMAASVGGLKALSVILGGLPADFPAAIAIVMHVAPDHKSLLAEILKCRTHLQVKQAHTGDVLAPSNVFVAPPNHHLFVVKGGRLKLSSAHAEKIHFARPSAEPLFASVAEVYQKKAIAVVLTGGDGDGSFGVQIIKKKGGQVIAQDRPTSENFSMPETSIKTGDVDFILPLEEIAPTLIALVWGSKKSTGCRPIGKGRMPTPAAVQGNRSALAGIKRATPHYAAARKAVMLKHG